MSFQGLLEKNLLSIKDNTTRSSDIQELIAVDYTISSFLFKRKLEQRKSR